MQNVKSPRSEFEDFVHLMYQNYRIECDDWNEKPKYQDVADYLSANQAFLQSEFEKNSKIQ